MWRTSTKKKQLSWDSVSLWYFVCDSLECVRVCLCILRFIQWQICWYTYIAHRWRTYSILENTIEDDGKGFKAHAVCVSLTFTTHTRYLGKQSFISTSSSFCSSLPCFYHMSFYFSPICHHVFPIPGSLCSRVEFSFSLPYYSSVCEWVCHWLAAHSTRKLLIGYWFFIISFCLACEQCGYTIGSEIGSPDQR